MATCSKGPNAPTAIKDPASDRDLRVKQFLGKIPFDPQVVVCGDSGVSYLEKYPDAPITGAFRDITVKIGAQDRPGQARG